MARPSGNEGSPGDAIRVLRTARGVSIEELAAQIGHTRTYVSLIERGEYAPGRETISELASAFDIPVQELLAVLGPRFKRTNRPT